MSKLAVLIAVAGLGAIAVATIGVTAEKKDAYMPQVTTKALFKGPLHGVEGKRATIVQFTLPPGYTGGKHYHTGPVFVYVAKGALTVEEKGKDARTFRTGDLYVEPVGVPMQGFNKSTGEPTEIVVFQVHGEGEPLMYKTD